MLISVISVYSFLLVCLMYCFHFRYMIFLFSLKLNKTVHLIQISNPNLCPVWKDISIPNAEKMRILMVQMLVKGFCGFFSVIGNLCYPTNIFIHSKSLGFALPVFTREWFPFIQVILAQCLQHMQKRRHSWNTKEKTKQVHGYSLMIFHGSYSSFCFGFKYLEGWEGYRRNVFCR